VVGLKQVADNGHSTVKICFNNDRASARGAILNGSQEEGSEEDHNQEDREAFAEEEGSGQTVSEKESCGQENDGEEEGRQKDCCQALAQKESGSDKESRETGDGEEDRKALDEEEDGPREKEIAALCDPTGSPSFLDYDEKGRAKPLFGAESGLCCALVGFSSPATHG